MKNLKLATIYREDAALSPKNADINQDKQKKHSKINIERVFIDKDPVDFLLDIIDKQCEFQVLDDNDEDEIDKVWRLRYFIDSPYEQVLYVSFASCSGSHSDILGTLENQCQEHVNEYLQQPKKMVSAVFIETSQYEPTPQVIHYASYLIRNTSSLVFDTLTQHSDRFIHVDGRGSVLLSPNQEHENTFEMQVILLALAKAYLLATSEIISELGECCEDFSRLKNLYKEAIIFNAKSYFACPVKVNRYDAYILWQDIRRTMPIDDINNEIVQQVQSIHRLLSEEEDVLQYQTELKISKRLGWMGVGIGSLSLVSLFEITPVKVGEFINGWLHFF